LRPGDTLTKSRLEIFFDRYSDNWSIVKQHPKLRVEPDVGDIFICPLCIKFFTRDDLRAKAISLEHVPPEKYGGTVRTVTCASCNKWAGTTLESELGRQLKLGEVLSGTPGSSIEAKYSVSDRDDLWLFATIQRPNPETWQVIGDPHPKRTNPRDLEEIQRLIEAGKFHEFKMTMRFRAPKPRHPEAALLRIAYLWTFSVFGYGFLLNFGLPAVRGQIRYPEQTILPTWGILSQELPSEMVGVNIITAPEELRSYLVVFDLDTPQKAKVRYGVILPSPVVPGLKVYKWLEEHQRVPLSTKIRHFPDHLDFMENPFAALHVWNETALKN
jgi:hypothetical protein